MSPWEIKLSLPLPFNGDTFGNADTEAAACWLVVGLRRGGSLEDSIRYADVVKAARYFLAHFPDEYRYLRNPFYRPDFTRLVREGWAEEVQVKRPGTPRPMRFTAAGLERIHRWRYSALTMAGLAPASLGVEI